MRRTGRPASGQQDCLVHHVRQIYTRETGGTLSNLPQIDATVDRLTGGMHLQDALAALHIGRIHTDLMVETTRHNLTSFFRKKK